MFDTSKYNLVVRPDFSMVAIPRECYPTLSRRGISVTPCKYLDIVYNTCTRVKKCQHLGADRLCEKHKCKNNRAVDGFALSPRSRVKIRSSINALYLGNPKDRDRIRFVTFTFPELPDSLAIKSQYDQDQELYKIFKKFLRNEYENYGLKKYVWVNERQKETRNTLHFHCLFLYDQKPNYENINLRFVNLLRRHGFDIYSYGFRLDCFADCRNRINNHLDKLDYKVLKGDIVKFDEKTVDDHGRIMTTKKSVFFQPFDAEKPISDVVKLGYYLSKYVSKDDTDVKVYCCRWHCSRGLFNIVERGSIFNEFSEEELLEIYKDIDSSIKEKGGYKNEKTLDVREFEVTVNNKLLKCYYFAPCFRKWQMDSQIRQYFIDKFNFYLT